MEKDREKQEVEGAGVGALVGGTIREVIINVSSEPYVDLELEALAMMKRD